MELFIRISLIVALIFLNGFFVAAEFALVAIRKTRVQELVRKKRKHAKLVQHAVTNLNTYISATQLGITIASLSLGWVGEATFSDIFNNLFNTISDKNIALFHVGTSLLSLSFVTVLHIVLGELVPKTIALQKTETTSFFVIRPLVLFTVFFEPAIWMLNQTGNHIVRIFGFKRQKEELNIHSEEELIILIRQSGKYGVLEKEEAERSVKALELGSIPIREIMIPIKNMIMFYENEKLATVMERIAKISHSRFPVYNKSDSKVTGFFHIKDIYRFALQEKYLVPISQLKIIRKIVQVKESDKADDILLRMREKRIHMAAVYDKRGKTVGMVTLEDILERLVGEIKDEFQ